MLNIGWAFVWMDFLSFTRANYKSISIFDKNWGKAMLMQLHVVQIKKCFAYVIEKGEKTFMDEKKSLTKGTELFVVDACYEKVSYRN